MSNKQKNDLLINLLKIAGVVTIGVLLGGLATTAYVVHGIPMEATLTGVLVLTFFGYLFTT